MRLVRIEVENFGPIREADVAFGPGLNVLYGPNDLGKSTLAEAVRLALLLPSTSTVHEAWVPWTGSHRPMAQLTFWANDMYWKVRKEFGPGNHASLRKSSDGVAWDEIAKGRAVDAKIREILNWGIVEPGGANAPRGLPTSFLATALLSTQSDVGSVLAASLEGDSADTGKQRVAAVLSALAQDPLFKKLIDATNERYDKAFTAHGKKKTAADSVLKSAADRVRVARVGRDEAQKLVLDSMGVQTTLSGLVSRRDVATGEAKEAAERLDALLALRRWSVAKQEVDRIAKLADDVDQLAAQVAVLEQSREGLRLATEGAEREHDRTGLALRKAEEDASAGSGDAASAETVERQRHELAIADAQQRLSDATRAMEAGALVRQRVADADSAALAVTAAASGVTDAEQVFAVANIADQGARESVTRLDLVERYLDLREAEAVLARVQSLDGAIAETEAREGGLRDARAQIVVPDRKTLATLRTQFSDLAIARGKLEVGLAVTIEPVLPHDVTFGVDGGAPRAERVSAPVTVDARGSVEVVIDGVAKVRVVAGNAEAREKAASLAARWTDEAMPILSAAGVAAVEGLTTKMDEADDLDRRLTAANKELGELRGQLRGLSVDEARERAAEARAAIGDATGLDSDLAGLGKDPRVVVRTKRTAFTRQLEQSKAPSLETAVALRKQEAEAADRKLVEAVAVRDQALAAHPDDLDSVVAQATASKATSDLAAARSALEGMDKGLAARRAALDALLAGARKAVTDAATAVEQARRKHQQAIEGVATAAGQLGAVKDQVAGTDAAGARERLDAASAELAGPGRAVTDQEIAAATLVRDQKARARDGVSADMLKSQGALEQVGGAVADEHLREAEEALQLAEQQERDVEAEYDAWRMLRDTMVEAEAAQASHLGQALGPLVSERLSALTAARYQRLAMTAQLATEGVVVGGHVRGIDRLSVGTRDQLSTLYRLCLAERLQSALVLDDQLVQSDGARLDWFRSLLIEKSKSFQIVVLTCRPADYAVGAPPSGALAGEPAPDVRAINLLSVVRRA